jgi:hypothetical protein
MDGKRDPRSAAPLKDPEVPAYKQSKFDEALADLRRHNQQQRRKEERPRHSPSPYGRRQPSPTWRPRDRMRGEEAGHPRSEASRRDHRQTEEYDPRDNWKSRDPRRSGESWQSGESRGRGRGRGVAPADHRRSDRGGRKEDRVISHKSSRSSPPSIHRETAAASSGGHEPRPGPSRGSPPPIEASRKKSRLESPKGHSPEVSEIPIVKTVTKKKRESKKKLVTRSRNWYIRDGKLIYKPHRETIFQCSTTLKEERTWLRTLSFSLRPMGFVDSLLKPSKLPVPQGKDEVPKELIRHPGMMLKPRPRFEDCHSGRCSCVVHGMRDVDHRTSVLHDVCLRSGAMTEKDLAVEPRFKNFVENPSHYYYWSVSKRDHLLGIPQPFRNNGSWTPAFFNPVLSDCSDKVAAKFYLDIYSKENARKMAHIYMTPPSEWESASHPCLGEPEVGSDLWRQSHLLYGVESVPRMNYCRRFLLPVPGS